MKIYCLIENSQKDIKFHCEHGLSLFVETDNHKILCDAGQSAAFISNSMLLGADIENADILFLSHGHYDHSDGFEHYAWLPKKSSMLYVQKTAFRPHYHGDKYIGIKPVIGMFYDKKIVDGDYRIDDELFIFSDIRSSRLFPKGNLKLMAYVDGQFVPDDFSHEQCLVISENGVNVLISGCAHNGIVNILDRYRSFFDADPDYVISGFHMMKDGKYTEDEIELIEETARELNGMKTVFYTGHCTGQPAFDIMKNIMGDKLRAIHSGETVLEI